MTDIHGRLENDIEKTEKYVIHNIVKFILWRLEQRRVTSWKERNKDKVKF